MNLRTLTLGILLLPLATLWAQTNVPPVRVALVSTCGGDSFANELVLAGAKLSNDGGITLVERAQIERVLEEQHLWRCGLSDAQQALAAGRLLGVQLFAAVETLSHTNPAPGIVIFDARTGARLWDGLLPEGNLERIADGIAVSVRGAVAKWNRPGEIQRTVCLLSVRNTGLPRELDAACDAIGRILERQLIESSSLSVLERERLEQINAERTLPGQSTTNGLLASLTLIEIEVSRAQTNGGLKGIVFMTDPAGRVLTSIEASVPELSPGQLVKPLLAKLLKALDATPLRSPPDRPREAQRFLNESIFLWNDGNRTGAWRAAEAAVALESEQLKNLNQLARCLAANANDLFQRGGKDVKTSLPHAQRAIELCRQVRRQMLANHEPPPFEGLEAERMIVFRADYYQMINPAFYWNEVLRVFDAQDAATKASAVEFQSLLWETRFKLNIQFWYARATNQAGADDFSDHMEFALRSAERLAPSATAWVGLLEELLAQWLDVFSTNRVDWGGWTLASIRPLAGLCCIANDCARRPSGMTPPSNWDHRRLGDWHLQAGDCERLGRIFDRMIKHPDPVIQCYGLIGQFALATRGKTELNRAELDQFEAAKRSIRERIASPATRAIPQYDSLAYSAARDLIDMVPDEAFRRREHQALFEWMLARREVVYWTTFMAVAPGAMRFAQYHHWPVPFPTDSVGYTEADHPLLVENERRVRELFVSTNRLDVDATRFSFKRGSFLGELSQFRVPVKDATSLPEPWERAETLFTVPSTLINARICGLVADETQAIVMLLQHVRGESATWDFRVQCVRVPLNGAPVEIIGTVPTPNGGVGFPDPIRAVMAGGNLYLGGLGDGIWTLPVKGGQAHKLDRESGLLSDHVGTFTVADGKLYAMLDDSRLVALDLKSKRSEILAHERSKDIPSPFSQLSTGFEVLTMLSDAPRHRVLFTTRFNEVANCHPLIGLWQIDTRTGRLKQLLETFFPITWMTLDHPDQLLLYCPRNAGENGLACKAPFYSLAAMDLRNDTAKVLWMMHARSMGPTLVADATTIRLTVHASPPFLVADDWLWLTYIIRHARLSLVNGELEDFTPPVPTVNVGRPGWHTVQRIGDGRQVLATDAKTLLLLTLPKKESKESAR